MMMEILSSWATFIGWIVIIGGVIHFLSKIIEDENERKRVHNTRIHAVWAMAGIITLRDIYLNTDNEDIKNLVKNVVRITPGIAEAMLLLDK